MQAPLSLVTGGSGYFGERLCDALLRAGQRVRVFDLNPPANPALDFVAGDVRDAARVAAACQGADVVYHNVAQVPIAKDSALFWSVNRDGTRIVSDAAQQAGVRKLVYTSSSAVFGVPRANPVTEDTPPSPAEDYGRAKLAGEEICRDAAASGFDVSIVRPRTILGHGRLGILQILFDWISRGFDVPVLGRGDNLYQFVHADDLAAACIAAAARPGFAIYNVGAERFGTMRETLEALCAHAGTGSHVKSVPMGPTVMLAEAARHLGISPLWSYHSLMYGRSLYFDISKAKVELGFAPRYSNVEMICESYDWYLAHRANLAGRSAHTSPVRKGVLALVPWMLKLVPG